MNALTPKRVFIVDDDEFLQTALSDYLHMHTPHEIFCYNTGEECMLNLQKQPHVIIMDYYLNAVEKLAANGLETMQAIRRQDSGIHFIMLSSQERYGIALQSLQKGAEQYVIKDKDAFERIVEILREIE